MKKTLLLIFTFCLIVNLQATEKAADTTNDIVAENFIIVVGQFSNESSTKELLTTMEKEFKDAGVFYDANEKKHYVYIETYYAKTGADYAVWWLKKNRPSLPKVWSKTIEAK
ncbi:MAG: hypothetical protein ACI9Z3_001053 [Roseivirga sp.]|jgi:hypothetical protein